MGEVNNDILTNLSESIPWLLTEDGQSIDYTKSIRLFDGVKLVKHYLETRRGLDSDSLSEVKISELLQPFTDDTDITVLDLYKHIDKVYSENKTYFDQVRSEIISNDVNNSSPETLKPLGELGDTTFNEALVRMKEWNWNIILDNPKIGINVLPAAVNFVSYSLLLRAYMKHIHNRPYDKHPGALSISKKHTRNRILTGFILLGAPAVMWGLRITSISTKDIFTVDVHNPKEDSPMLGFVDLWISCPPPRRLD